MKNILLILKTIRIKSYIKNFLIFIPFVFSNRFLNFDFTEYKIIILGFLNFCFTSSIVYIINDILDIEKDKLDEKKKHRPIASGQISKTQIYVILCILFICIIINFLILKNIFSILILLTYFILNIFYSLKLKNLPILDITLLSLFFLIRVFYGGQLLNIEISSYLYLTILSFAYYFGIGKRLKELNSNIEVRDVLKKYPKNYLENTLNIFFGTSILFYSLWVLNSDKQVLNNGMLELSIFLLIVIMLDYHYLLHIKPTGNPTDLLFENKSLLILAFIYCIIILLAFII